MNTYLLALLIYGTLLGLAGLFLSRQVTHTLYRIPEIVFKEHRIRAIPLESFLTQWSELLVALVGSLFVLASRDRPSSLLW